MRLQQSIQQRLFFTGGGVILGPKEIDRVTVQKLAEKSLSSFVAGPLAALSPNVRAGAIKELQAMRVLLQNQIRLDNAELNLATTFVNQVEAVPIFFGQVKPT